MPINRVMDKDVVYIDITHTQTHRHTHTDTHTHTHTHTHTGILLSHKKNEVLPFEQQGWA